MAKKSDINFNVYAPGLSETVATAIVAVDDTRLSHLLSMTLREAGVAVWETSDYNDIVSTTDGNCRLYMIDVDIKSGNAIELVRKLRDSDNTFDSAMVILSCHDNEVDAYDAGADMVLSKPISVPLFMARIRSVMRRYKVIL